MAAARPAWLLLGGVEGLRRLVPSEGGGWRSSRCGKGSPTVDVGWAHPAALRGFCGNWGHIPQSGSPPKGEGRPLWTPPDGDALTRRCASASPPRGEAGAFAGVRMSGGCAVTRCCAGLSARSSTGSPRTGTGRRVSGGCAVTRCCAGLSARSSTGSPRTGTGLRVSGGCAVTRCCAGLSARGSTGSPRTGTGRRASGGCAVTRCCAGLSARGSTGSPRTGTGRRASGGSREGRHKACPYDGMQGARGRG